MPTVERKSRSVETKKLGPESISPSEKMTMLLRVFNLGSNPEQNQQRRRRFLDLIGKYHHSLISSRVSQAETGEDLTKQIIASDKHRKELHDQIMSTFLNASLSRGISQEQKILLDHLARNREAVKEMIGAYFSPTESVSPTTPSQVFRGAGPFFKKPGDQDD